MRSLVLMLITVNLTCAQSTEIGDANVDRILEEFKSSSWAERSSAFDEATRLIGSHSLNRENGDKLRVGLIGLLSTENTEARTKRGVGRKLPGSAKKDLDKSAQSEERSEYYGDLIGAVADFNDARAIPALLGATATGGMASRSVAGFGKTGLDVVLVQITAHDPALAGGAVFVLRDMLEFRTVNDAASLNRIKNGLRLALARPELAVREPAIFAIEFLADREDFVPLLRLISDNDPIKIDGLTPNDSEDGGQFYPVRRDARILLNKIATHEAPVIDQGAN